MEAKPVELTDASFDEFVKTNKFAVVDLWAPWCGPCQRLAPIVEKLAERYAGKVAFGKLNVDEHVEVPKRFGVRAIPTLLFFRSGALVDVSVGLLDEETLEEKLRKLLGSR